MLPAMRTSLSLVQTSPELCIPRTDQHHSRCTSVVSRRRTLSWLLSQPRTRPRVVRSRMGLSTVVRRPTPMEALETLILKHHSLGSDFQGRRREVQEPPELRVRWLRDCKRQWHAWRVPGWYQNQQGFRSQDEYYHWRGIPLMARRNDRWMRKGGSTSEGAGGWTTRHDICWQSLRCCDHIRRYTDSGGEVVTSFVIFRAVGPCMGKSHSLHQGLAENSGVPLA